MQRNLKRTRESATVNPLRSPPGGRIFSSTFEVGGGGLNREGGLKRELWGLFNLAKRINGGKVSREDGLVVPGRYTAFSNNKKMATILRTTKAYILKKLSI